MTPYEGRNDQSGRGEQGRRNGSCGGAVCGDLLGEGEGHICRCAGAPLITRAELEEAWPEVSAALHRYLRSRGVSATDADDVVQDVALKAMTAAGGEGDQVRNLVAWAIAVGRNVHRDQLRRATRVVTGEVLEAGDGDDEVFDRALQRISLRQVLADLGALAPADRNLLLHAAQGTHPPAERREAVARNVRVHRLRARLRHNLLPALLPAAWLASLRRASFAGSRGVSASAAAAALPFLIMLSPYPSPIDTDLGAPHSIDDGRPVGVRPAAQLRTVPALATHSCPSACSTGHALRQTIGPHPAKASHVSAAAPTPVGPVSVDAEPSDRPGRALLCWHDTLLHPQALCLEQPLATVSGGEGASDTAVLTRPS